MAANKPILFDIKANINIPAPPVVALEQKQQQPHIPTQKEGTIAEKQKKMPAAKNSNLGVALTMKKITKSPIPDVMPALLPNQPVQVLGQTNIPPVANPNNTIQQPQQQIINPAVKHPAAGNKPIEFGQNEKFKPETTHPAVLEQRPAVVMNISANKSKKRTRKSNQTNARKTGIEKKTKKPTQKTKSKIATHRIFK